MTTKFTTGFVRKVDPLGRIVIPIELRRTLQIQIGDPMEVYTNADGEITFKKCVALPRFAVCASSYASTIHDQLSLDCFITDMQKVIAASGDSVSLFIGMHLHKDILTLISERRHYRGTHAGSKLKILQGVEALYCRAAVPILSSQEGEPLGSILLLSDARADLNDDLFRTLILCARLLAESVGQQNG